MEGRRLSGSCDSDATATDVELTDEHAPAADDVIKHSGILWPLQRHRALDKVRR